jgi:molybdopterin/thiamine biosynthesis adenylyltransferase
VAEQIVRLQASWSFQNTDDGGLELVSVPQQRRLRFGAGGAKLEKLLSTLAQGVPADDATASLARSSSLPVPKAARLLSELERAGALIRRDKHDDVSSLDGTALYDRQIRFLSLFESVDVSGLELNRRLQQRKVVIPGLGGLGGWLALLCARIGIREIVGIDPDTVELSNLHRQILYTRRDIGQPKSEACAERLLSVDPEVRFSGHAIWIQSADDVRPLLKDADLVVNGFPHFVPSFAIAAKSVSQAALEARVPCLNMPFAQCVGPLTLPGETACVQCAWDELKGRFEYATKASPPWARQGFLAALAPRQAISGGVAIWEALRFLSGMDRPATLDGALWLDIAGYRQHGFVATPRHPDCSMCGRFAPAGVQTASSGMSNDGPKRVEGSRVR